MLFSDSNIKVNSVSIPSERVTHYCEYYNETMCTESNENGDGQACFRKEECDRQTDGKRNHCFAVWKRDANGNMNITLKVCL